MLEYTPEAAQAIEGSHREFTHRLMVDWDNDKGFDHPLSDMSRYVEKSSRDQAINSTAPDELMLIEGYAAASLDITVTGEHNGLSLVGHFAPYNGKSVFYAQGLSLGVEMYYDIGVLTDSGWEWFRQFTGIVREVDLDRETNTVVLHCLDYAEKMRTPVQIPPYGMYKDYLINGYKRAQLVDSSSLIDLAARSGGFSAAPNGFKTNHKRRDSILDGKYTYQTILSVPFHGSHLPEIGHFDNQFEFHLTEDWEKDSNATVRDRAEQFTAGPHGYLALNAVPVGKETWGDKRYWCDFSEFWYDDDPPGITCLTTWIYWPGPTGDVATNRATDVITLYTQLGNLKIRINSWDGGLNALFTRRSDNVDLWSNWLVLPTQPGWYNIGGIFKWTPSTTDTLKSACWINETRSPVKDTGWDPPGFAEDSLNGLVTVQNHYAMSDLEIFRNAFDSQMDITTYSFNSPNNSDMSWGRNRITYTLREETEAWQLAKDVAAAEYGTVFFDENGVFKFWTYDDVLEKHNQVAKQLTIDDVSGLSLRITMDSVRNTWQVTSRTGYSDYGIVYDFRRDDVPYIRQGSNSYRADFRLRPAGTMHDFWIQDSEYVMCANPTTYRSAESLVWNDYWPVIDYKPYTGSTYRNIDFQMWIRKHDRNWTSLKIFNGLGAGDANIVGFVGPNDTRYFRIGGTYVTQDPERTWTYSTDDLVSEGESGQFAPSIPRYGYRVIELGNKWVQDEFQTRMMLKNVMKRYGRPTPVTDAITVPGDPRIQLGDCIDISDPDGLGGSTRLQVLGINRDFEDGVGLKDTYQVEVIERPGIGRWDNDQYGRWDLSLIWS